MCSQIVICNTPWVFPLHYLYWSCRCHSCNPFLTLISPLPKSGAWWSDWALCLARTNWDVPKHRGLTVFMLPIHQPGIEVHRIEMLNGSKEFCQEFITDVRVPDSDRVGEVDGGWSVVGYALEIEHPPARRADRDHTGDEIAGPQRRVPDGQRVSLRHQLVGSSTEQAVDDQRTVPPVGDDHSCTRRGRIQGDETQPVTWPDQRRHAARRRVHPRAPLTRQERQDEIDRDVGLHRLDVLAVVLDDAADRAERAPDRGDDVVADAEIGRRVAQSLCDDGYARCVAGELRLALLSHYQARFNSAVRIVEGRLTERCLPAQT